MRAVQFSVVSFPKLQQDKELLRLRERFAPGVFQLEPYIPVVLPWVPVELGDVVAVVNCLSETRRKLHPIAIVCDNWHRKGELLLGDVTEGQEAVLNLRKGITGVEPVPLIKDDDKNVYLVVCQVPDEDKWGALLKEAQNVGRSLGVLDSVVLIRTMPDGSWQRVANFPFGVGRVDFYEQLVG
ncbi:MAG: hypothetical protein K6T77_01490 [candidate division WOR-3 bacterium]|jgi:hypothetical protein|nr:hypothetical protein [candidate division WOR-3 bacterium]MCR4424196.1 hypothetical protein [candidate division WOR-3 bacterium]MDH7519385.1 hypothetical protein [bacterium]